MKTIVRVCVLGLLITLAIGLLSGCSGSHIIQNASAKTSSSETAAEENIGIAFDVYVRESAKEIDARLEKLEVEKSSAVQTLEPFTAIETQDTQATTVENSIRTVEKPEVEWCSFDSFIHGDKPVQNQKYIVLHDTEGSADPYSVAQSWSHCNDGAVAAHFVIGKDGSIVQCGELDQILHHAGWGGPGDYDSLFGVGNNDGVGDGDDMEGVVYLDGYTSYGMNAHSIGIEMVHIGGEDYPEAQLEALDRLIAYIDSYYDFQSEIIDHKAWRPSNSDTDANFTEYLANYQDHRCHN